MDKECDMVSGLNAALLSKSCFTRIFEKGVSVLNTLKKYWFIIGLVVVFGVTMADTIGSISVLGKWLKHHKGPDTVIVLIFLFSGLLLDIGQIKQGLTDIKGLLIALFLIFIISPVLGAAWGFLPLPTGVIIGMFLVASMPTTLSSGVVMTGASGGNMAHALLITICASWLSVFTIPFSLSFLLQAMGNDMPIHIDRTAIMIKIGLFVLVPLITGILIKHFTKDVLKPYMFYLSTSNQIFILGIVWMAVSESRQVILDGKGVIPLVCLSVIVFHTLLVVAGFFLTSVAGLKPGKRESVIFMGGQKTLPLSIIIQVTLFPQLGAVLVVCVLHHILHLMIDGWMVGRLKKA